MKISTVKQECSDGDKATITGMVKWVGVVESHPGKEGEFRTQSLLIADGEQTDDKQNSIFCGFYADKGTYDYLKGQTITVQGTINEYQGKKDLRGCKIKENQTAPQQGREASPQPAQGKNGKEAVDWDAKDLRMARMSGLNNATKIICLLAEMTKNDIGLNVDHVKGVASEFVDYIYNGIKKTNTGEDVPF